MKTNWKKFICQQCVGAFQLDKDFKHNLKYCPYCKGVSFKEVSQ